MGYYFVGVRRGELSDGELSSNSVHQIEETARLLKESKISSSLPKVVYSDGSAEGEATAKLLAEFLGLQVEVNGAFASTVKQMKKELTWLENHVGTRNIAVCWPKLLQQYLLEGYRRYKKEEPVSQEISLMPGECVISEQHDEWGFELYVIYPSKGRKDVLAKW